MPRPNSVARLATSRTAWCLAGCKAGQERGRVHIVRRGTNSPCWVSGFARGFATSQHVTRLHGQNRSFQSASASVLYLELLTAKILMPTKKGAKSHKKGVVMPNSPRTRFDVGLLTSEEVSEISLLIKHESSVYNFSAERKRSNPAISGMYKELADLGLVALNIDGACTDVLPMAHWAVEKYNQEAQDKLKAQKRAWKHDFAVAGFGAFCGGVMGIAGTLLGVWYGALIG